MSRLSPLRNRRFSVGASFLIFNHPGYIAIEFENEASRTIENDPLTETARSAGARKFQSTNDFDLSLLAGTTVYKNLGVGVYARYRPSTRISEPELQSLPDATRLSVRESSEINRVYDPNGLSLFSIGVEFGQFSGGLNTGDSKETEKNNQKISYSLAIGYSRYGSDIKQNLDETGDLVGENTAPLVSLFTDNQNFADVFSSPGVYFGFNREEVNLRGLSWYTLSLASRIITLSNVGMALEFDYRPGYTGHDATVAARGRPPEEPEGGGTSHSDVRVDSFRVQHDTFVDLDFPLSYGELGRFATFRLSPTFRISYEEENAVFDERLNSGTLNSDEISLQLVLFLRFVAYLNSDKTFALVFGWTPSFNLHHRTRQTIKDLTIEALIDNGGQLDTTTSRGTFQSGSSIASTLRLGLQYTIFDHINLHIGIRPNAEDAVFSLNQIDFGVDVIF